MKVIHCGTEYDCAVAVKCENDCYIILYDSAGAEIASFNGISDFSAFTISGGSFVEPASCEVPIPLTTYVIGGKTITTNDWILSDGKYHYEISNSLISENPTTCNVLLFFAEDTSLNYESRQESGKLILYTDAAPLDDVVITSIQITRA